jgi:hypothetical protein
MDMRLAETVDQIAKRKQALDPFGLWQFAQAADDRGVDGENYSISFLSSCTAMKESFLPRFKR